VLKLTILGVLAPFSNFTILRVFAMATFSSSIASLFPIQALFPAPNDRNAYWLNSSLFSEENLQIT